MSSDDLHEGLVDDEEIEAGGEVANLYPGVVEFVSGFLTIVYARPVGAQITGFRWCPRWWEHPEALSRLEALWKAFETLRQDPGTGAAVWWRDYADPTMSTLCSPEGPFKGCSPTSHVIPHDLPMDKPPASLLARIDHS